MKRISHRMVFLLVLMAVLAVGLVVFAMQYGMYADDWVTFPGSPHVYNGGNLSTGQVTDREGVLLLENGENRDYATDAALRRSTMHLLGDRFGYISAPVLNAYSHELVGFSPINGLYSAAEQGSTAELTVSAEVQKAALAELEGRKGTIGIYNYETGEILCAVTTPTYDPDQMPDVEGDVTGAYDGVYLNRLFQTTYVPGSIFKIVTAAAALETMENARTMTFQCTGSCEIGGDTINCNGVHGTVNLQQALGKSCNVAFGQLAVQLGAETLTEYAEKFGITESVQFDGITTAAGNFDLEGAADSQIAWAGIGQYTDLVNPCQFLTVLGAIANDGRPVQPHLMKAVHSGILTSYEAKTEKLPAVLKPKTAQVLSEMMHRTVTDIYGAWQFPDLYVCAKSGTAELGPEETPHATFAGFIRDPQYPLAFVVIVEHGGSGSAACAPIAGRVLQACVDAMDREAKN